MTLYDFCAVAAVRRNARRRLSDSESLRFDDLLSRGSENLGLSEDGEGFLSLSEGTDFG